MIRVGIAGIGFMGMMHYRAHQRTAGAEVRAISSRDPRKRRGDWRHVQGNFGPPGEMVDLCGITAYETLGELVADDSLDLIDICLPTRLHADAAVEALRAGRHVLCEKPMALSVDDAQRMVAAAAAADRQLMIGHVLPYFPEYAFALEAIQTRRYGRLLGMQLRRSIAEPLWLPDYFDPARIGGPLVDLHIHDAHFVRLACGMPTAVSARGRMRGPTPELVSVHYQFDDSELVVTAQASVLRQQGRSFAHGFEIYLERATLLFDFAIVSGAAPVAAPLRVLTSEGRVVEPPLAAADPLEAFVAELNAAVHAVAAGSSSAVLDGQLALDALLLCQRAAESIEAGQPRPI